MSINNDQTNLNPRYRYSYSGDTGYDDDSYVVIKMNDNFNVSKPIPASDHQYLWITSSLTADDRAKFGYGYATSSTDMTFISSSEYTDPLSDERGWTTNFAANLIENDTQLPFLEISTSLQAAGYEVNTNSYVVSMNPYYTTQPTRTKVFMSRMNGPYNNPIWRQLRATHPVIASLGRTANLVLMDTPPTQYDGVIQVKARRGNSQTRWDMAAVTSKFRPLLHGVEELTKLKDFNLSKPVNLVYDYSNLLAYFPYPEIDARLSVMKKESNTYSSIYDKYIGGGESNIGDFRVLRYSEVLWPKEANTYLGAVRNREIFQFNWRDERVDRTEHSASNSQGHVIPTSSMWLLDARVGSYRTTTLFTTASVHNKGDVGELFNVGSIYHNGTPARLTASALFAYPMPDSSSAGVFFTNDTDFKVE